MGILIDTNLFIAHERGRLAIPLPFTSPGDEFFVSVITASELLHGVHRARETGIKAQRAAFVEAIIERYPILPIDLPSARVHAQLSAELASQGMPVGPSDLWLAATAIAHGLSMATANVREFARVPGLTVQKWVL
jgi:predicted nucleic acid-binding protein